ncbi:GTPase [Methanococcus voltae]|uniref:Ribosome biogenesis GTPase A n=2 Tax=Methanococcus voltae TaxID=2188 RepID=A0A8J7URS3_METVO|nr:GTPase [Methanococcus voltae]MBP2173130.1 ribosome biogenesis GTPase A [Methanococcus voltae]MBP2202078.1 ribosome biogenesis GTPase A [Methanococcus voltae]MCS3922833.1 ribosome biogenesis GTPase A [Methanococcus voltae PS]
MEKKKSTLRISTKLKVKGIITECDVILLVVDARDPETTRNYDLESSIIHNGKKLIYVLNKADLVPKEILEVWKKKFMAENPDASVVFVSATHKLGTKILRDEIKLHIYTGAKNKAKNKSLSNSNPTPIPHPNSSKTQNIGTVGVVGYPNVGKSSIINSLTGKKSARSGLVAGLTVGEQWIKLTKDIKLLDTPGIIEPNDDDELIISGALRFEKSKNITSPTIKILQRLQKFDNTLLSEYYGIEELKDIPVEKIDEDTIELIGKKLNYLAKGGITDINRASRSIIVDFQSGKLNYYKNDRLAINTNDKSIKNERNERIKNERNNKDENLMDTDNGITKKVEKEKKKDVSSLKSSEDSKVIFEHLKDCMLIEDAKQAIMHLEKIPEIVNLDLRTGRYKVKKILACEKIYDSYVLVSVGERTKDTGRKRMQEFADKYGIELYSEAFKKIGNNNIYIGIGEI